MEESGGVRFPGSLDPRAQEFRPRNPAGLNPLPHHVFYSFASPYPPISEVHVLPFYDGAGYPQFQLPPPYVTQVASPTPVRPPAQPPLAATRSLLLTSVPIDVSESAVRRELEVFGEVRAVEMERVSDGVLTVHFYDLRNAEMAFREIRELHMNQQTHLRHYYTSLTLRNSPSSLPQSAPPSRGLISGRAVWAQFVTPASNAVPEGRNQGTIVVFNLDSDISTSSLRELFEVFGPVKELRETPLKKSQRFVEFFDTRDAARALKEMNGKEVAGKPLLIEFSRPGGHSRKLYNVISSNPTTCPNSNSQYPNTLKSPPPSPPAMHYASKRFSHHSKSSSSEALMASLNLSGDSVSRTEERPEISCPPLNTFTKKVINLSTTVTNKQSPSQPSRIKMRKGRQPKKFDSRFSINEDQMVESECRDSRTTVMIKNIPNKYSQKLLLNMLDNHCIHCNEQIGDEEEKQPLSSYDFVYLPIDFNNKCNVGYGFVNMTSPEATWRLYKAFHFQHWEVFNSRKICQVTYARVQGLEALKDHFKNSKFPCEMDHYLPVVFSPPRDGRQLTEPLPIAGQKPLIAISASSEEAADENDEDMDDGQDTTENFYYNPPGDDGYGNDTAENFYYNPPGDDGYGNEDAYVGLQAV